VTFESPRAPAVIPRAQAIRSIIHLRQEVRKRRRLLPSWIQSRMRTTLVGCAFMNVLRRLWTRNEGQDIAEYAVMLAVILILVVGTIRLVGSNANTAFSSVASSLQ
jgi:Flp pilus assembly pilin Flp